MRDSFCINLSNLTENWREQTVSCIKTEIFLLFLGYLLEINLCYLSFYPFQKEILELNGPY